MKTHVIAAALLLPGVLLAAVGRDDSFQPDAEPDRPSSITEGEAWREGSVALPPWPKDADLVAFVPDGPPSPFRYLIDTRHLSRDERGALVRFTLVAEGPGGLRNLSYEGIRCTLNGAYRIYGYGVDGRLAKASGGDWLPIDEGGSEPYRWDLWKNRFCVPREGRLLPAKDMLRALRDQGSATQDTGFQAD